MKIREALERAGIIDVIEGMADMRGIDRDDLDDSTLKALTHEEAEFTVEATRPDDTEEYAQAVAYAERLKALLIEVE
jgi:hypothetical protein